MKKNLQLLEQKIGCIGTASFVVIPGFVGPALTY